MVVGVAGHGCITVIGGVVGFNVEGGVMLLCVLLVALSMVWLSLYVVLLLFMVFVWTFSVLPLGVSCTLSICPVSVLLIVLLLMTSIWVTGIVGVTSCVCYMSYGVRICSCTLDTNARNIPSTTTRIATTNIPTIIPVSSPLALSTRSAITFAYCGMCVSVFSVAVLAFVVDCEVWYSHSVYQCNTMTHTHGNQRYACTMLGIVVAVFRSHTIYSSSSEIQALICIT